ncbi:hypothetical protein IFR04_005433 [Cadophora malorum]|uniref:Uncharacterized protein n=1 Tax=Cadophora malorum TaxID=108018 RepID=A0A8H7TKN0_9HELO|nr:hypothetical protein IFR04_005433 [Cadophora malorum]
MTIPVELIPTTTFEFLDSEGNGALSLRQKCLTCSVIYLMWATVAGDRLAIGLWRSFATGDEGKGFTDAAYVVAVGGIVVFPIQSRHGRQCRVPRPAED